MKKLSFIKEEIYNYTVRFHDNLPATVSSPYSLATYNYNSLMYDLYTLIKELLISIPSEECSENLLKMKEKVLSMKDDEKTYKRYIKKFIERTFDELNDQERF